MGHPLRPALVTRFQIFILRAMLLLQKDCRVAEKLDLDIEEQWRRAMRLDRMIKWRKKRYPVRLN